MSLYGWLVFVHVISALVFILGHGVSAFVVFRVRGESDRARLAALLDLSAQSLTVAGIGLLVALVSGIVAAINGDHFAHFWPWASIIVLVVVGGLMTPVAAIPLAHVRRGIGQPLAADRKQGVTPDPVSDDELAALRARVRPELTAAIGLGGLALLVWMMEAKPF